MNIPINNSNEILNYIADFSRAKLGQVDILHCDGSAFKLQHADCKIFNRKLVVITEHCGYIVFYKEDLLYAFKDGNKIWSSDE